MRGTKDGCLGGGDRPEFSAPDATSSYSGSTSIQIRFVPGVDPLPSSLQYSSVLACWRRLQPRVLYVAADPHRLYAPFPVLSIAGPRF